MKKLIAVLGVVVTGIVLIGCGESGGGANERVVKLGHIKGTILNLPEDVLKASDILEKKGVKYQIVDVTSSNEVYEAVVRGDIDMTSTVASLPVLLNYDKQPDAVKVFSASDLTVEGPYDYILVKKDSDIKELKDMSGKKLKYAVFPGSTHATFTKLYLTSLGIDISNIEIVPMPSQNHLPALEVGSIDVLGTYDPMAAVALATGNYKLLGYSVYAHGFDHNPHAFGIVNPKFAAEFPDLARQVAQSYQQAYDLMIADPVNSHKIIANVFKLEQSVADQVNLPKYASQLNFDRELIQKYTDYLFKIGEIKSNPNISSLFVSY